MKIFLSGCSGSGKSTLAKKLSEIMRLPLVIDIIPQVLDYGNTFHDRQKTIEKVLLDLLRSGDSFVCDRCILDAIHWTQSKDGNKIFDLTKLENENFNNSIFIISPTPSYEYHNDIYLSILLSKKRVIAYHDLLSLSGLSYSNQVKLIHDQQLAIENSIKEFLKRKQVKSIFPSSSLNSYFDWAENAITEVMNLSKLENVYEQS